MLESLYTRSQSSRLLEITTAQLDYLSKQFEIVPKKLGQGSIYTLYQLLLLKIALYLKSKKYPVNIIDSVLHYGGYDDDFNMYEPYTNGTHNKIEYRKTSSFLISCPKEDFTYDWTGLDKSRIIEDHEGYTVYLLYNQDETNLLKEEILDKISETKIFSLKPVVDKSFNELKESGKKHNISIPEAA